jgi:4-amino-4-deoxy-L-arabinose transferase-like glycosyltransferase
MSSVQKSPEKSAPVLPQRLRLRRFSRSRRALIFLLAGASLLYGLGLGQTDLWAPDEPRYGAIAEELRSMRHGASGLVLLHLNDTPYTQKPPLYFWLAAAIGAPFERVHETAARLPSAIAGVLCIGLTAWIGRMLFGRPVPAILAAGLLATSFRFAFTARRAQLDVLLTCFELVAIAIFLVLESRRGGIENARRFPLALAGIHASLGAAALVKGPVGWLPLLVFAGYLAWEGRLRAFRAISPFWAWTLSLGPISVWILAAVALAPAGFAEAAVGENLIGRFFAGTSHARPFYYFAIQLPLDFLPWSLLLPFAIPVVWGWSRSSSEKIDGASGNASDPSSGKAPPSRPASAWTARFLLAWLIVPLVFFSLSAGKRGLYLLPIFPALALVSVLAGSRATAATCRSPILSPITVRRFMLAIAIVAGLELAGFTLALPRLDSEKSPRPIAEAAASFSKNGEPIGVYGMTPLEGGIAYYGAGPLVSLRDESQLQTFLSQGGKLVILRGRHLDSLGPSLGLRELQSFRSGRRRLALAQRTELDPQRD